ncbi:MAG: hypothetical protein RSC36_09220, partial [Ruthenibacterium sp.]
LLSALRMVLGAAVLCTVPLFAIYYSYTTDCSGFFQGDVELRATANMVLSGQDIIGYEKLNNSERDIMKILAANMEPLPQTIALGSSRILQLTKEIARTDSFFNCAMTGGDAADVLSTFYLFDRENRLPDTVIIGFDPWLLRDDVDGFDKRSDKALYTEFLNEKLGFDLTYEKEDNRAAYEALYSPIYFQDNLTFTLRDSAGINKPQPVTGDLYSQTTEVKCSDGSLLYDAEWRNRTQELRDSDAYYQTENLIHMQDYPKLGTFMPQVFDRFFAYAQSRGVNLVIVLTPFHPIPYDFAVGTAATDPMRYGGFLATEPSIRQLAAKYNIPVYGSYNPHAIEGVTSADFYDGLHCTGEALEKLMWGHTSPDGSNLPAAEADDQSGAAA